VAARKKPVKKSSPKSAASANRFNLKGTLIKLFLIGALVVAGLVAIWAYVLNERVVDRFSGTLWKLPATVYAAPQEIYVGPMPIARTSASAVSNR
jgi:penicillin-binding protein 1B